jgi:hypothetical protein
MYPALGSGPQLSLDRWRIIRIGFTLLSGICMYIVVIRQFIVISAVNIIQPCGCSICFS